MEFRFDDNRIAVNIADATHLLREVDARFARGDGFALATINLDHLVKLRDDPDFRRAYAAHDLISADGNPIVWLSRLAKRPVALVAGSDMVDPLVARAHASQVSVALVGATDAALDGAAQTLETRYPGLTIAAKIAPPMGFDPQSPAAETIIDQVRASGARLCLIALGAPKQERFAALGRIRAPEVGFASIGASLDFLAGTQVRAPAWVRKLALEWMWRLLGNPKRLARRYALCAMILPGQAWAALRLRRG